MWKVSDIIELMKKINLEAGEKRPEPMLLLSLTIDELVKTLPDVTEEPDFGSKQLLTFLKKIEGHRERPPAALEKPMPQQNWMPNKKLLMVISKYCRSYIDKDPIEFFSAIHLQFSDEIIRQNDLNVIFAAFFDRYINVCHKVILKFPQDSLIRITAKEVMRVNYETAVPKPVSSTPVRVSVLEFRLTEFLYRLLTHGADTETYLHIPLNDQQIVKTIAVLFDRFAQQKKYILGTEDLLRNISDALVKFAERQPSCVDDIFKNLIKIFDQEMRSDPKEKDMIELGKIKLLYVCNIFFMLKLSDENKALAINKIQSILMDGTFDSKTCDSLAQRLLLLRLSLSRHEIGEEGLKQFITMLYNIELTDLILSDDKVTIIVALCKAELAKLNNHEFIYGQSFTKQLEISMFCNNLLKIFPQNFEIEETVYKVLNFWAMNFSYKHQELKYENRSLNRKIAFHFGLLPYYQFYGALLPPKTIAELIECLEYGLKLQVATIIDPPQAPVVYHYKIINFAVNGSVPNEYAIEEKAKYYCANVDRIYALLANIAPEKAQVYKRMRYEDSKKIMTQYELSKSARYDVLFENCLAAAIYEKAEIPAAWKILVNLIQQNNTSILNECFNKFKQVASKCLAKWPNLFADVIDLFYRGEYFARYALAIIRSAIMQLPADYLRDLESLLAQKYHEETLNLASSTYYYKLTYLSVKNQLENLCPARRSQWGKIETDELIEKQSKHYFGISKELSETSRTESFKFTL